MRFHYLLLPAQCDLAKKFWWQAVHQGPSHVCRWCHHVTGVVVEDFPLPLLMPSEPKESTCMYSTVLKCQGYQKPSKLLEGINSVNKCFYCSINSKLAHPSQAFVGPFSTSPSPRWGTCRSSAQEWGIVFWTLKVTL